MRAWVCNILVTLRKYIELSYVSITLENEPNCFLKMSLFHQIQRPWNPHNWMRLLSCRKITLKIVG